MGFVTYPVGDDGTTLQLGGPGLAFIASQTFTAAATVSLNGCFTAAYTDYRVMTRFTASTGLDILMKMRGSGVDSSASYNSAWWYAAFNSTSGIGAVTGVTSGFNLGTIGASERAALLLDIFSPGIAETTKVLGGFSRDTYGGHINGNHAVTTAYDGFTLIPSTGTITGTVTVYGYQKG